MEINFGNTIKFHAQIGRVTLNDQEVKLPFSNKLLSMHSDLRNTIHIVGQNGISIVLGEDRMQIVIDDVLKDKTLGKK